MAMEYTIGFGALLKSFLINRRPKVSTYPFDPTGVAASNKIATVPTMISVINYRSLNSSSNVLVPTPVAIPNVAPFFTDGLEVRHRPQGTSGDGTLLVEGLDYLFIHPFTEASRQTRKRIVGGVMLTNPNTVGTIVFKNMQVLGGEWTITNDQLMTILTSVLYNPRVTQWGQVTGLPASFPVIGHPHNISDFAGFDEVVEQTQGIHEAIYQAVYDLVRTFGPETYLANLTKHNVGLDKVMNYPMATEAMAADVSNQTSMLSPWAVRIAMDSVLANLGLSGGAGGSGTVIDPNNFIQRSGTTFAVNELMLFNNTTGTTAKASGATLSDISSRRVLSITGANPGIRLVNNSGAGRTVSVAFPAGTETAINLTLPAKSGTLLVESDLNIDTGSVPFRSGSGVGRPNTSVPVSSSVVNNTIARRDANGTLSGAAATENNHLVNFKQANDTYLAKNDTSVLKLTSLVNQSHAGNTTTAYTSAAVKALLGDYLDVASFQAWVDTFDPTAGEVVVTALPAVILGSVNSYQAIDNTNLIVASRTAGLTINLPTAPIHNSRFQVSLGSLTPGVAVVINGGNKPIYNYSTGFRLLTPNTLVEFKYEPSISGGSWIVSAVKEYVGSGKRIAGARSINGGYFTASSSGWPPIANYELGTVLYTSNTVVIGGVTYFAGTQLVRLQDNWLVIPMYNEQNLEAVVDALINGFNAINAAL